MANACPKCGFENASDARQCADCGAGLPPIKSPPAAKRKIRLLELLLVLFVAFSASIVASLYQFFGGEQPITQAGDIRWVYGSLRELAALGVLAYVLFRQGCGFAGIAAKWKLTDIPMTLVLLAAAYGGYVVWVLGVEQRFIPPGQEIARQAEANRHLLEGGASVAAVVFMIINGFFEEFIVRAFVITQLRQLTGSAALAIFASVAIQVSYHLYQGLPAALSHVPMFLIFSIYYQRTNRIFPIAMAHVTMDLLILFHHVTTVS
jgi:membrane protease YdiL (CAAX protease family)